ncbi:MAG: amidohydrolase [Lautropia sp.]
MPPRTQPPDPVHRKPASHCPAGAIDCHIHLFGPASRYPFDPGSRYVSDDALPETNVSLQDALGLAGAIVVSGGGYGPDTTHLEAVLRQHPGRFRGVALLPENVTPADIARLDRLGVRGARFVSAAHRGNLPRLDTRVASMVADVGWHVQFYPGRDDLVDHADALLGLPVPVVLDHFACLRASAGVDQPGFGCLRRMLDSGRVWVKLSGPMRCSDLEPPYADVAPIARALALHSPERLLWGSDWPHVNMNGRTMPNDADLFDLLAQWVPDDATRRRILVDNPRTVYGAFAQPDRPAP